MNSGFPLKIASDSSEQGNCIEAEGYRQRDKMINLMYWAVPYLTSVIREIRKTEMKKKYS